MLRTIVMCVAFEALMLAINQFARGSSHKLGTPCRRRRTCAPPSLGGMASEVRRRGHVGPQAYAETCPRGRVHGARRGCYGLLGRSSSWSPAKIVAPLRLSNWIR